MSSNNPKNQPFRTLEYSRMVVRYPDGARTSIVRQLPTTIAECHRVIPDVFWCHNLYSAHIIGFGRLNRHINQALVVLHPQVRLLRETHYFHSAFHFAIIHLTKMLDMDHRHNLLARFWISIQPGHVIVVFLN